MKKINCIGIGPGDNAHLTVLGHAALIESEVILGYKRYIELIRDIIGKKPVLSTEMRQEIKRARLAVNEAIEGKTVGIVSSGDTGVYGMAGLVFEVANEMFPDELAAGELCIKIIPGIPALIGAASLLGAPIGHDFCSISLSDLLTPWELIEKRLKLATEGDFVIALYNPRSSRRDWQLKRAIDIMSQRRSMSTPVGIVKRAMRKGQEVSLCTLSSVPIETVDMETIVIVGNSSTFTIGDYMITPRGYMEKYGDSC